MQERDSGLIMEPNEEIYKNKHLKLFCPDHDCKDPERRMFTKKSKNGKFFFSHYGDYRHDIRPETLLHKLAIAWFQEKTEDEIPGVKVKDQKIVQQLI